jgi:uncharacterized membrane protein YuzA (DUF378 family)
VNRFSPVQLILVGLALLLVGFLLPFVMVLRLVEPTLLLGFVSYLASFMGLVIGLYGVVTIGVARRKKHDEEQD